MLNLGIINTLTALRRTDNGVYLVDAEENEVLLPNKYVAEDLELGDSIDVFLYKDSEDRAIATNLSPFVMLHEYAALEAKAVVDFGAFFEWGLEKDLLVPHSQQATKIEEGKTYVVYLYLDAKSERLVGSTKIKGTLERSEPELEVGQKVDLLAFEETEIGVNVIVDNTYQGILYKNEIFEPVSIGDELSGYVKKLRTDNKIDVSLNKFGYRAVDANVKKLYSILVINGGSLSLNDKSAPEAIVSKLGMSKKIFKKAIGALYKQKQLEITDTGITLINRDEDEIDN